MDFVSHQLFEELLQPYTHDRPSKLHSMQQELRDALLEVASSIAAMAARGVLPDEVLVLEAGSAITGPVFRCLRDSNSTRYYRTAKSPPVGQRIPAVPSTDCDYATCEWVEAPW